MRTPSFLAESIRSWLHAHKVATQPELKQVLGTEVGMTVFRKLRELGYHSSYSHRGQYYTLNEIARFDEQGLWSHHGIWFSRHGSLLNSAESFVQISEAGYFSHELENLLHVSVKEALLQLVSQRRLTRESLAHRFLYCASEPALRKAALRCRKPYPTRPRLPSCCSSVCSTSSNAACTPGFNPCSWATAVINRSPNYSASIPTPWPKAGINW